RPSTDPIAQPTPDEGAGDRPEPGGQKNCTALPVGQLPFLGQGRGHVADQEEIKEIQQIRHIRGADQLPLIARQLLLRFEALEHHALPFYGGVTSIGQSQARRGIEPGCRTVSCDVFSRGCRLLAKPRAVRTPIGRQTSSCSAWAAVFRSVVAKAASASLANNKPARWSFKQKRPGARPGRIEGWFGWLL